MKKTNLFLSILAGSVLLTGFLFAGASKENKQSLKTEAATGNLYIVGLGGDWDNFIAFTDGSYTFDAKKDETFKLTTSNNWYGTNYSYESISLSSGWSDFCCDDGGNDHNIKFKENGNYTITYTNADETSTIKIASNKTTYYLFDEKQYFGNSPKVHLYKDDTLKTEWPGLDMTAVNDMYSTWKIDVPNCYDHVMFHDNAAENIRHSLAEDYRIPPQGMHCFNTGSSSWIKDKPSFYLSVNDGEKIILEKNSDTTSWAQNQYAEYYASFDASSNDKIDFYFYDGNEYTKIANSPSFGAAEVSGSNNNIYTKDGEFYIATNCAASNGSSLYFKTYVNDGDVSYSVWANHYANLSYTGPSVIYTEIYGKQSTFTIKCKNNDGSSNGEDISCSITNSNVLSTNKETYHDGDTVTFSTLAPGTSDIVFSNGNSKIAKTVKMLGRYEDLITGEKLGSGKTSLDIKGKDFESSAEYSGNMTYANSKAVKLSQRNSSYILGKSYVGKCKKVEFTVTDAVENKERFMLYYDASNVKDFSFSYRPDESYISKESIVAAKTYTHEFEDPTSSPALIVEGDVLATIENIVFYWDVNEQYGLATNEILPSLFSFYLAGNQDSNNNLFIGNFNGFTSKYIPCKETTKDSNDTIQTKNLRPITAILKKDETNLYALYDEVDNQYLLSSSSAADLSKNNNSSTDYYVWQFNKGNDGMTVSLNSGNRRLGISTSGDTKIIKNYTSSYNAAYVYINCNDILHNFYKNDLKMGSILLDNNKDTGCCRGESGYFATAKATYNTYGKFIKYCFSSNASSPEYLRFVAWADANNMKIVDSILVESSERYNYGIFNDTEAILNDQTAPIVIIATSSTAVLGLGYLYLKKKKQDN